MQCKRVSLKASTTGLTSSIQGTHNLPLPVFKATSHVKKNIFNCTRVGWWSERQNAETAGSKNLLSASQLRKTFLLWISFQHLCGLKCPIFSLLLCVSLSYWHVDFFKSHILLHGWTDAALKPHLKETHLVFWSIFRGLVFRTESCVFQERLDGGLLGYLCIQQSESVHDQRMVLWGLCYSVCRKQTFQTQTGISKLSHHCTKDWINTAVRIKYCIKQCSSEVIKPPPGQWQQCFVWAVWRIFALKWKWKSSSSLIPTTEVPSCCAKAPMPTCSRCPDTWWNKVK